MANVNTTLVSNLLASPQVANPSRTLHGTKRTAMGTIALAAGDLSATDTVMLAPIPSNAGIVSIVLYNDDIDSGTTITCDVGVYSESGGTFTAQDSRPRWLSVHRTIVRCGRRHWWGFILHY